MEAQKPSGFPQCFIPEDSEPECSVLGALGALPALIRVLTVRGQSQTSLG